MAFRPRLGAVSRAVAGGPALSTRWSRLSLLPRVDATTGWRWRWRWHHDAHYKYAAAARALSTGSPRLKFPPEDQTQSAQRTAPPAAGSRPCRPLSSSLESFFGRLQGVPVGSVAFGIGVCFVLMVWLGPIHMALRPGPEPDTPEDGQVGDWVRQKAQDHVPLVRELSEDAAWTGWEAYEAITDPAARQQHLMAGTLRGSRGVGAYQRVFVHKTTGEVVTVVYFGRGTSGWPGVVHGGLLASVMDECCGRAAFRAWEGRTGVTAHLEMQYKLPTRIEGYYVVRARVRDEDELPVEERGKRHYKVFVDACIEDPRSGAKNVLGSAVFVGGSGRDGNGPRLFGQTGQPKGLAEGF